MHFQRIPFHLLVALFALVAIPDSLFAQKDITWFHVESEHYAIATDVDEAFSQKIADYMEGMYVSYEQLLDMKPPASQKRFRIEILKNQDDYAKRLLEKHRQQKYAKPDAIATYVYLHYGIGEARNVFCGFVLDEVPMFERLRHEGFHQYFRSIIDQPPQWLNEGLAEMLEGYNWDAENGLTVFPSRGMLRTMREGLIDIDVGVLTKKYDYVPIRDIMTASKPEWLKTNKISYPESWAICYFLTHGPEKYRGLTGKVLDSLSAKNPRPKNNAAAMKVIDANVDFDEFEPELLQFFRELEQVGHEPFVEGQSLMQKRKYAEAVESFSEVIELDPLNARAYYFRGTSYYSLAKFDQAEADLKRAIELFPEYGTAICVLGQVYVYTNDFENATKYLKLANRFGVTEKRTKVWFDRIKKKQSGAKRRGKQ